MIFLYLNLKCPVGSNISFWSLFKDLPLGEQSMLSPWSHFSMALCESFMNRSLNLKDVFVAHSTDCTALLYSESPNSL